MHCQFHWLLNRYKEWYIFKKLKINSCFYAFEEIICFLYLFFLFSFKILISRHTTLQLSHLISRCEVWSWWRHVYRSWFVVEILFVDVVSRGWVVPLVAWCRMEVGQGFVALSDGGWVGCPEELVVSVTRLLRNWMALLRVRVTSGGRGSIRKMSEKY